MARYKLIYLLLLTYVLYVTSEDEAKEAQPRISTSLKPPDRLVLQKSQPYQKEQKEPPSFFSRIASWFYPFGRSTDSSTDSVPAEGHHGGPHYLPPSPPQYQSHAEPSCNPCNQEPWLPVASNVGHSTILNFVPPSSQYGAPPIFKPVPNRINYGLPGPPNQKPLAYFGQSSFQKFPVDLQNLRPPPFNGPFAKLKPPVQYRPQTTHLKPVVHHFEAPIGMRPPPLTGSYQTLPSTDYRAPNEFIPPPAPPPSDSYGLPIVGDNANYEIKPEYLPPLTLPGSDQFIKPVPLPNLSSHPVVPIHNAQNFHDSIPEHNTILEVTSNSHSSVEVVPSINIAEYLESVEHPVKVIQSPLLDLTAGGQYDGIGEIVETKPDKLLDNFGSSQNIQNSYRSGSDITPGGFYDDGKISLNENPIIVDDTHAAASVHNVSYEPKTPTNAVKTQSSVDLHDSFLKQILVQREVLNNIASPVSARQNKTAFTAPPMDYSKWEPSHPISTSMIPPPLAPSTWLYPVVPSTTKRPKQVQIIIPYINNNSPLPFDKNQARKVPTRSNSAVLGTYSTLLPVYSPPPSTETSEWIKYVDAYNWADSKRITATAFTTPSSTTQVSNIRDLLKGSQGYNHQGKLPFDVISLQNHIDDWTQQEFSKMMHFNTKTSTLSKLVPSKKIPDEFFTTQPYTETTTNNNFIDYEPAGSNNKESKVESDIKSNLIFTETTTEDSTTTTTTTTESSPEPFSIKDQKSLWDIVSVTVSPITKEKLYIVTPQPYLSGTSTPNSAWINLLTRTRNNTAFAAPKFTIRVDPENRLSRAKLQDNSNTPLTVVFSEWPHLINNLETTTTTTQRPFSNHPLLGLMDLSAYTPPPNSTVQTILGHSKVATVVTPSAIPKKSEDKEETLRIVTPTK